MFKKIVWLGFSSKWKKGQDISAYVQNMVNSWAWEFFTWYNPDYWYTKFGFEVSPNGRFAEHEQITDFDTLKKVVEEVHKHNLEIFVNLNAWYYTDETFPYIKKMVEEFISIWVDGIICWNISILEYLKDINFSWKINISTILALYNSESIKFFLENYDINKIILSREVTLKEIEKLVTNFPETTFEVFWEWDFCRYNNWLCFAEHKYSSKDICTVVVNDLIFKKKFRTNFKKFLLDWDLSTLEKVSLINDDYENSFDRIEELFKELDLGVIIESDIKEEVLKLVLKERNKVNLFFDAMKPFNSERNKDILLFYRALKFIDKPELEGLKEEIEKSIKSWMKYLSSKTKQVWGYAKMEAKELASFYAKWDNLNLYSYLFFSQFKNINTVKFPTRWRNYTEKLKLIEKVLGEWIISDELLDRWINIERTHYDLTYLFWDKLWFRKMLKNI